METDPVAELNSLGVTEILDQDSRPAFVVDLDPDEELLPSRLINPVFCNAALRLHEKLFDAVLGKDTDAKSTEEPLKPTHQDFKLWATGVTSHDDSKDVFPLSFLYQDLLWTGSTIRKRWRLISGNLLWNSPPPQGDLSLGAPAEVSTGGLRLEQAAKHETATLPATPKAPGDASTEVTASEVNSSRAAGTTLVSSTKPEKRKPFFFPKPSGGSSDDTGESSQSKKSITLAEPEKAVADWTALNPKGIITDHLKYARSINWAATPLGPMETWSKEFRQTVNLLMNNPHPASLFWGSDLTMIYNAAYAREVAGNKHPSLMGTGFSGPFSEMWELVSPVFAECARTGVSIRRDDDYLPIERHGILEETYFSWSWTPLYGGGTRILGFYNAPFETTQQVLYQRRNQMLNRLGERTSHAKTVKQFWSSVLDALEENRFDIPFALLYSVGDNEDADHSSMSSGSTMSLKSCFFEGSIAIPDRHPAAPHQLDLKRSREGFVPAFREAMRSREPTLLHSRDGTLPDALLEGIQWRGFGDPCREAIIFPVRPTNGETVMAFLLLGVNPRRPYDDEYKAFTRLLNRQLATSLASLILFEDEVRRSRDAAEAAAIEQERLTQQLAIQSSRLRRMTELSPLGMFLISPDGMLQEANDRFYEMTGLPRDNVYELSWMNAITDNSKKNMARGWDRLIHDHLPWSDELQLHRWSTKPLNLEGEPIDYWVLLTAQPEFASDSSLRSIMGSITDISHLKWAQGLQNRRLQEAEETRRQQNEFIDITSHEMRNPLSAILQCADDISSQLFEYQSKKTPPTQTVVDDCVDAANTIALCVQHQKFIVDDILTISKLDSNLLLITPIPAQPISVAQKALKMFDPELQAKNITVQFIVHPSIQELGVDWVNMDPSRILQTLINLMTNAIKFTAPMEQRVISIAVGATIDPPINVNEKDFKYIPARTANPSLASNGDWGTGDIIYLKFKVKDTGCGLSVEEKKVLFERFSQASPRTHAQYGGSGLGLFISRQLAEMHGGQIGVASEAGVGSTFGFFITARKTDPPRDASQSEQNLLPIEGALVGESGLSRQFVPQRLDFVTGLGPGVDLLAGMPSASSKSAVASVTTKTYDPKDLHVLVVEDNIINQKVLVHQLQRSGSTVSVANDGIEALAFLEETHFHKGPGGKGLSLILMDLEMPNMDGLTCVKHIRKMEEEGKISGRVPVMAVTANVREEQVKRAMMSGMDDVVSKPFKIAELYKKIDALLASMEN
jgi:PAS domain S-box-containing protein